MGWLIGLGYHHLAREIHPGDWGLLLNAPEMNNPPSGIRITILLVTDALGQVHGH
jgi:hypothetical protein